MSDPASSSHQILRTGYLPVRSDRLSIAGSSARLSNVGSQPYSRSRDSNQSDSVWEDAQSNQSLDEIDDTLSLLAAEISSRTYPTTTAVIMEDSPEQEKSVSESILPSLMDCGNSVDSLPADHQSLGHQTTINHSSWPVQPTTNIMVQVKPETEEDSRTVEEKISAMQEVVEQQFKNITTQIMDGQTKQQDMASAADALVESLRETLQTLQLSQAKHESAMVANEAQLKTLLQNNADLVTRNLALEQQTMQQMHSLNRQEENHRNLTQQTATIHQQQFNQQQQMGAHGQATIQMQQELSQMRDNNRRRTEIIPPRPQLPRENNVSHSNNSNPPGAPGNNIRFGPTENDPRSMPSSSTGSTPIPPMESPFQMPTNNECGFTPIPCMGFPNMVVDACPSFTPNTFQNWKREIKLWIAGQPGASTTQLLAKLIHVLPLAVKTEALLYMDQTERQPDERSIATIMNMLDARYGRTDSERACSWLTAFTEFKRESQENYKDFWARFTRCTAKLEALGMPMIDKVVFNRAIHALRLPEGQLPIVLSVLETRPDRFSVAALREVTIRMYETHKPGSDPTEVFTADAQGDNDAQWAYHAADSTQDPNDWNWQWNDGDWNYEEETSEVLLEDGSIMLMRPKKHTKPRNTPGIHEASRRGAVKTFSYIPNRKGKGKSVCLRCGDPSSLEGLPTPIS